MAAPGAVQRAGPAAFGADGALQQEEGRQDPGVRHGASSSSLLHSSLELSDATIYEP